MGRRKARSSPGPVKKGWRLERWQALLAAAIAAIATLGVALITTFGGASSGGPSPEGPSSGASVSLGSAAALAPAAAQSAQAAIAITSFSSVPWPPPPGEDYSFRGIISNPSSLDANYWNTDGPGVHAQVYVVECRPRGADSATNGSNCLQSPPANISKNGSWYVKNWHIRNPANNAEWAAMITETSTANVNGIPPPPPPSTTPADFKVFAYYLLKQAEANNSSLSIDAFSKPVS